MTDFPRGPMTEPCDECRFDPASVTDVATEISALGRKFAAPFTRFLPGEDGPALVRARPDPETWSPLEVACHVRDALRVFRDRTEAMVASDGVLFEVFDHEAAVVERAYNDQDPATVAGEIAEVASDYGDLLAGLSSEQRTHTGIRPPDQVFTVDALAVYGLHEGRHHLLDIGRGLRSARGR